MDNVEAFSYVFTDSLMSTLVLPIQQDVAFSSMVMFGNYNTSLAIIFAGLGAVVATLANILLGRSLRLVSKDEEGTSSGDRLNKIIFFMQKYAKFGLLFAWFPIFGAIFAVLVGFAKVKIKSSLLWIVVGCFGYYIYAAALA